MLNRICEGARQMGVVLPEGAAEKMLRFHELLMQANAQFNLTRVPDDPQEAVDRNYLDSLAPLAHAGLMRGQRLLDLGSGAGFPGIPLAIALPEVHVTLMDSLGKRVNFLQSVIDELGLNARAVHARAEEAAKRPEWREQFDCATARAVAALPTLAELTLPFVRVGGQLIAYKGPAAGEELAQAQAALSQLGGSAGTILPVAIPGREDWDHRLVLVDKQKPTPKRFPRKSGEAGRHPLVAPAGSAR